MVLPRDHYDPYTGEPTSYDGPPGDDGVVSGGFLSATGPILQYFTEFSRYPGNNRQWWIAKADIDAADASYSAGDFLPELLNKVFSGNNRSPRGHYILDAFYKDRSAVSGVPNLDVEITNERPTSTAFFSGRVWYGCNSTVYFSQVLTEKYKAGLCFQEADPTAEDISDLIATDGGVIPIPEANKIIKILPNAGGVLVFALNGVWYVTGTEAGFSALDISVNKVSPIGCRAPQSVVETENGVFWWSDVGIMGMSQSTGMYGPISGSFDKSNLSEETIQSFYNDITDTVRTEVKALFDPKANVVYFLYRDDDVAATQYNRVLVLDLSLNAFYPWKFESLAADTPYIKGFYVAERMNTYSVTTDIDPSQIEYITMKGDDIRFAQVRNANFCDWETDDGTGVAYESYVETGYELFNDAMRNKNITYIFSYFRRTETEYTDGELDDPSSCYLTVKFDWAGGSHSNKWTTPVQAYRPGRLSFDPDTGFGMVITKNKVRGNGKAIQFRFGTDEIGKNFDLHGWSVAVSGNTST